MPISVTCPQCGKVMNVPDVLQGKKVRCRGCEAVVSVGKSGVVPAKAAPKAAPAKGAPAKPVAPTKAAAKDDDEWEKPQAYKMTVDTDNPRCPHCANDIEEDQVVCLSCGYNLQKRFREDFKAIHVKSGGDYTLWLLPGIVCVIICLAAIFLIVMIYAGVPDLEGTAFEELQTWKWGQVYGTCFALFILWVAGKFAVKRLIMNPHPPDEEKNLKEDKDEDDDD